MEPKRITVFAGHYGSGKTQLAINYALWLREKYPRVVLADLDIVNPYYRTTDALLTLQARDITLIASGFANSNVDAPSLPPDTQMIFDNTELQGVLDVGGDERGALALGRYASYITPEAADVLLVINRFRPQTKEKFGVLEILKEIEAAAHITFTGIVNNSHLGGLTTVEDIISSEPYAQSVAELCRLPLLLTTVGQQFLSSVDGRVTNPFPITLYTKEKWKI